MGATLRGHSVGTGRVGACAPPPAYLHPSRISLICAQAHREGRGRGTGSGTRSVLPSSAELSVDKEGARTKQRSRFLGAPAMCAVRR